MTAAARGYRAVFRCTAGCPGDHSIWQPLYRCPTCGALLQVVHDVDALRDRSAADWLRLFDDRYKRTTWPYGSGVWGKKEWVCPELRDENVVSMDEGGTNMFWAERFGRELGLDDLWVKQCGNSHTGSFKDLGMTVLVSVVKQMVADGAGVRAVACASTGDTSAALAAYAAAAGIPAVVILPRGTRHRRAAGAAARQRRPRADARYRLRRLHGDRPAAGRGRRRLPRELDEQPAASKGRRRYRSRSSQQFDWEVPDVVIVPGGNLGNVSAIGAGFDLMLDLGAHRQAAADRRRAGGGRQPALSRVSEQLAVRADDGAADDCVGDPDRQSGVVRQGDPHAAAVRRHRRAGDGERARRRGGARGPHRHVQLPPHRRRAGRAREARRARRDRRHRSRRSSSRRRTA